MKTEKKSISKKAPDRHVLQSPDDAALDLAALWNQYKQSRSEDTKETLILYYLPWIKRIAQKALPFATSTLSVRDLVSTGLIQLNECIDKYIPEKNDSFKNFSYLRIYGAMIDELRAMDQFPRSLRDKAKKIQHNYIQLTQSGIEPNDEDIAKAMNISLKQYWHIIQSFPPSLLPFFLKKKQTFTFLSDAHFTPEDNDNPASFLSKAEHKEMLLNIIQNLPEKSRMVLILYYYRELTLKEIGKVLSISESRVCQIHNQAIFKLKAHISTTDEIESYAAY